MIGGSGDDTFIVRAFLVAAGTHIGVKGGSGNDTIEYNVDAPVDIEGGTGFNTLVLLGTEANDTFVVTETGIFGGGLEYLLHQHPGGHDRHARRQRYVLCAVDAARRRHDDQRRRRRRHHRSSAATSPAR